MPRSLNLPSPVLHRALLFALAAGCALPVLAQNDKFTLPIDRPATGNANQADGARILADFQRGGIAGDYWLSFELRVLPRKGPERSVTGTLFGARGPSGPLSRLTIPGERWLIESGPQPSAWLAAGGAAPHQLAAGEAGLAVAGTDVTVFELQMPFLYWTDFTYEGLAQMRSRPTHSFVLRPPAGQSSPVAGLTGVRVFLDSEFRALVQAEELGAGGVVEKSITLLDIKKVGEQYLMKAIDVRNHRTRDKTRFAITGAALGLELPLATFSPENLTAEAPAVPPEKIVRF
jgi:hypothetical protein